MLGFLPNLVDHLCKMLRLEAADSSLAAFQTFIYEIMIFKAGSWVVMWGLLELVINYNIILVTSCLYVCIIWEQ